MSHDAYPAAADVPPEPGARPPSWTRRLARVLRRPRVAALVAALVLPAALAGLLFASGCSKPALVADATPSRLLPVEPMPEAAPGSRAVGAALADTAAARVAPTLSVDANAFLVLGDTQGSWRIEHRFYRRPNWVTWKQVLVPFYQAWLLTNGFVGGVNYLRQHPDLGAEPRAAVRHALRAALTDSLGTDSLGARLGHPGAPGFVLHLGDMAMHDGRLADHWTRFLREYGSGSGGLLDRVPVLPVIGNHETANDTAYGWPNYAAVFDYGRFYVVDLPHARLVVMDSNRLVDMDQLIPDDRQEALFRRWFVGTEATGPSWLERALAARPDVAFKIVAMHHPLFTTSFHEKDWRRDANGPDLMAKRTALAHTLKAHGVQLLLAGHEHLYEHNVHRYDATRGDDEPSARALHQVISSGGGAVVRPETPPERVAERLDRSRAAGLPFAPVTQRAVYHYSRVEAGPDTLRVITYAVDEDDRTDVTLLERVTLGPDGLDLGLAPDSLAASDGAPPPNQP